MGLRPTAARWFEVLTPSDELARTVEVLAATGRAQIESEHSIQRAFDEPAPELEEYKKLERRYFGRWPTADLRAPMTRGAPRVVIRRALEHIAAWARDAEPLLSSTEQLEAERTELELLSELDDSAEGALAELGRMAGAGPWLDSRLVVLPRKEPLPELPNGVSRVTQSEQHTFLLLLTATSDIAALEHLLAGSAARRIAIPELVKREPARARPAVRARLVFLDERLAALQAELALVSQRHRLNKVLGDVQRLEWFLTHVPRLERTRHFALITGWTSDSEALRSALEASEEHALIHFPASVSEPPIVLRNPLWAKPFELFSRLLGTPSAVEVDPSGLLVLLAPLLFGFMFADIGQGAVLLLAGSLLRRRMQPLAMLIPGGLSAMLFGLLFGSVFGRDDLIRPLWIQPLEEPLLVLGSSVALGALVLGVGLGLSALGASWRRELGPWLQTDGALSLAYVGLIAAVVTRTGLFLAALGALLRVLVPALRAQRQQLRTALIAAGELLERALQLGVNTVSFARVGAFCLAHAGFSLAILELSRAVGGGVAAIVVLLLGNVVTLLLEGLVVGIQTTRLVLFEFFARFFQAKGRAFVPLIPPASDEAMLGA